MGKNQRKQNYNNKSNQNRNYESYNTQRQTRTPRVNPNEVKAQLYLPEDLCDNVKAEIIDVISKAKFSKISVPLGTYRCNLDESNGDDERISTIGYMRKYDPDSQEFTVIVFNNFIDIVKGFGDLAVELLFTTNKDKTKLGTITKFNLVPIIYEDAVEQEANSDATEADE